MKPASLDEKSHSHYRFMLPIQRNRLSLWYLVERKPTDSCSLFREANCPVRAQAAARRRSSGRQFAPIWIPSRLRVIRPSGGQRLLPEPPHIPVAPQNGTLCVLVGMD